MGIKLMLMVGLIITAQNPAQSVKIAPSQNSCEAHPNHVVLSAADRVTLLHGMLVLSKAETDLYEKLYHIASNILDDEVNGKSPVGTKDHEKRDLDAAKKAYDGAASRYNDAALDVIRRHHLPNGNYMLDSEDNPTCVWNQD
jgi:hypothetical protein